MTPGGIAAVGDEGDAGCIMREAGNTPTQPSLDRATPQITRRVSASVWAQSAMLPSPAVTSRFKRVEQREFRRLANKQLRKLRDAPSPEGAIEAARGVLSSFDAIADTSPAKSRWACAAGCNFCCHMPVHLSAVEAVDIANRVLTGFGDAARRQAVERIAATAESIGRMSEREFKNSRTPCALLDDEGRCSVYDTRPLACRGFHSTSVEVCKSSFESNDTRCDDARDRATEDLCARMVVAMHAVSRTGALGDFRFELHSALSRLLEPGGTAVPEDVARALEGARGKPSPFDVPLDAVIGRFRDP